VNETILSLMSEPLHANYTYVAVGNVSYFTGLQVLPCRPWCFGIFFRVRRCKFQNNRK